MLIPLWSPCPQRQPPFKVSTELFVTMITVMAVLGANGNSTDSAKMDGIDFLVDTSFRIWVMMIEVPHLPMRVRVRVARHATLPNRSQR